MLRARGQRLLIFGSPESSRCNLYTFHVMSVSTLFAVSFPIFIVNISECRVSLIRQILYIVHVYVNEGQNI